MGYESRIYVVEKSKELRYAEVIAMFNLCKMGGFCNIFNEKIDYRVFLENKDAPDTEDSYGDALKETTIEAVIDYIEYEIKEEKRNGSVYRRLEPVLSLLKGFDKKRWDELSVIHWGY